MSSCTNCAKWVVSRERHYGDGTKQTYFTSPDGKGYCKVLKIDTTADFGCLKFAESAWNHIEVTAIDGAPWEHWTNVACPDCNGVGSANDRACRRCSGTAKVRRYDDGYVADATWDHPLEKERKRLAAQAPAEGTIDGTVIKNVNAQKQGAIA